MTSRSIISPQNSTNDRSYSTPDIAARLDRARSGAAPPERTERTPETVLEAFEGLPPVGGARAAAVRLLLDVWREWRRRGRARRELARLDGRTLHDIGLSRAQAEYEAAQPFWRPLRDWRKP